MANENKDVLRVAATEATLATTLRNNMIGMTTDTNRIGWKYGGTLRLCFSKAELEAQGVSAGSLLIGAKGITGVTPTGGGSGDASTLQAMLEGIKSAGGVPGSGTTDFLAKWSSGALVDSIISDDANGITFNGATSNIVNWGTNGVGAPTALTRSPGSKIVLYSSLTASETDYAIGVASATTWFSVPGFGNKYKYYWGVDSYLNFALDDPAGTPTFRMSTFRDLSIESGPSASFYKIKLVGDVDASEKLNVVGLTTLSTATISSTMNLSGLTASRALALDASKNVMAITNTGSGNNVLSISPTIYTPTISGNITLNGSTYIDAGSNYLGIIGSSVIQLIRIGYSSITLDAGYLSLSDSVNVPAFGQYRVDGTKVVGARETGWYAATGTASTSTFATSTVTLEQLAQRVKALIDSLMTHGLIG